MRTQEMSVKSQEKGLSCKKEENGVMGKSNEREEGSKITYLG